MTGKEAARLFVTVGADTSSFQSGMRQVQGSLNQTSQAVQGTMGLFKQFALGQIVGTYALQGLNAALGFASDAIIGFNAKLEQANIGFTTMLGSGEAATKMLNDLKQFAAATPFRFEGLLDSSKRLLAMGYTAEEIIPVMRTVGDAVAGLGAGEEGISRATYALGQMKTAGRILSQDMMQLTSLGVPAWRYLAEAVGGTTAEVRKMVEQGLIPADDGVQALLAGMEKDFGGLMAKQSQTFTGALSNIADMLQQIVATGFEPFFTEVSKAAVALATFLQSSAGVSMMNNLKTIVGQVVDVMKTIIPTVFNVIGAIAGFVAANPWVMQLVGAFIALRIALVGLSIISAVVGMIQGMVGALGAVRAAFAVAGAATGFSTLLYAMSPALWTLTTSLGAAATAVGTFTLALLTNPITWIILGVVGLTAAIVALGGAFDTTGEQAKRSAEMTTDAWKDTHSYLTEQNATAERDAKEAGTGYAAAYADGIVGAGAMVYAAGGYISAQATKGLHDEGVPRAAAAGAVVGATFGKEMQSAAMIAFRAGERDISKVNVQSAEQQAADYLKRLQEAYEKLNTSNLSKTVGKKVKEAITLPPKLFESMFSGIEANLSGGLLSAANGAIKDIIAANVAERFAAKLTPRGKAIYQGFVTIKNAMVDAAQKAVDAARAKFDELKYALADVKNAAKDYASDIRNSLTRGISVTLTDLTQRFREVRTTAETVVAKTFAGITRVVREATESVTLEPIATSAETVVNQFRDRVNQMQNFIANLKRLRDEGLSSAVLRDIIGMGVEGGSALAAAIAEGGRLVVDQINDLQRITEEQSQAFGDILAQDTFGAQIAAAQSAVQAQEGVLRQAEKTLADAKAFDPIAATQGAINAIGGTQGIGTPAGASAITSPSKKGNNKSTATTNNGPVVTVQNLNVGLPTVAGYGAGEAAQDRALAARIAAEVANALNSITAVQRGGYILK